MDASWVDICSRPRAGVSKLSGPTRQCRLPASVGGRRSLSLAGWERLCRPTECRRRRSRPRSATTATTATVEATATTELWGRPFAHARLRRADGVGEGDLVDAENGERPTPPCRALLLPTRPGEAPALVAPDGPDERPVDQRIGRLPSRSWSPTTRLRDRARTAAARRRERRGAARRIQSPAGRRGWVGAMDRGRPMTASHDTRQRSNQSNHAFASLVAST